MDDFWIAHPEAANPDMPLDTIKDLYQQFYIKEHVSWTGSGTPSLENSFKGDYIDVGSFWHEKNTISKKFM